MSRLVFLGCIFFCSTLCAMTKIKKNRAKQRQLHLHAQLRSAINKNDCPAMLQVLAQPDFQVDAVVDQLGNSALHLACEQCVPDACQILLGQRADSNLQNIAGQTPLHVAAYSQKNYCKIVFALLKRGASVTVQDNQGNTPLHEAFGNRAREELLQRRRMIHALLEAGAPIDVRNAEGVLPAEPTHELIIDYVIGAMLRKQYARVLQLLAQGVDVNRPLDDAFHDNDPEYLLKVKVCSSAEYLLEVALYTDDVQMVTLLLDNRANPLLPRSEESESILSRAITFCTLSAKTPMLLFRHIPKPLIKKYREDIAIPLLLCCKRAEREGVLPAVPLDIKKLLCFYCIKISLIRQLHARTVSMLESVHADKYARQYLLAHSYYSYLFDPDKIDHYYPIWEIQISDFLNNKIA